MAVGGIAVPRPDHAEAAAEMALAMQKEVAHYDSGMGEPGDFPDSKELAAFAARCLEEVKQRGKKRPLAWRRYRHAT